MTFSWLRSRRFWLLILVGVLISLVGSQLPLAEWFTVVNEKLATLGIWAVPAFILVYFVATILGLPNILLILVAGSLFGLLKGTVVASIADILGAVGCFLIGRTLARDRISRWVQKRPQFARIDQAVERKGWKVLLLTRLSPLLPSSILNYGFSCTNVNFWQYVFFSWVGMLPVITLYTYMGSFGSYLLTSEITAQKVALQGVGLVFALGAALYITRFVRRALIPPCSAETPSKDPETSGRR
ncbi:TVP38/TMEM64 family protein [Nodosilinea sp. LEGE 06152]|uniref:TVP38/TMEM64 family protein n=1 Tax=Nodosilinea sp. LEGE 06152 TaxID=2777966 RepID=UPI001880D5E6|nr:TVP38/TMEM64 family protein [Nodosilinea sp. LEGE 06152]MBE9158039.1 TVP38/TMEM64 family protein [Nodosilinea sp. LEGE 06152]